MTPQESEALGFLEVDYKGFRVRTSLPDQWPLHLIRQGRIIVAAEQILGDRFDEFLDHFPSFEDLTQFTQALAEAAGIPGAFPFGGVAPLLWVLDNKPDEVERQLASCGADFVDYYRGELSLRKVGVLMGWDRTHFLLADVFHSIARIPHPDRPLSDLEKAKVEAAAAEQKRHADKLHARETQYTTAAQTARENALKAQGKGKHA